MSRKPSNTLNVLELMGNFLGLEIEKILILSANLHDMARTLFSNALERLRKLDEQIKPETSMNLKEEDF